MIYSQGRLVLESDLWWRSGHEPFVKRTVDRLVKLVWFNQWLRFFTHLFFFPFNWACWVMLVWFFMVLFIGCTLLYHGLLVRFMSPPAFVLFFFILNIFYLLKKKIIYGGDSGYHDSTLIYRSTITKRIHIVAFFNSQPFINC